MRQIFYVCTDNISFIIKINVVNAWLLWLIFIIFLNFSYELYIFKKKNEFFFDINLIFA